MTFRVNFKNMSGRTMAFDVDDTTVLRSLRPQVCNSEGPEWTPERLVFVNDGGLIDDDDRTLHDLGITPNSTVRYLMRFQAPAELFDGRPHPMNLMDVAIGGADTVAGDATQFFSLLQIEVPDAPPAAAAEAESPHPAAPAADSPGSLRQFLALVADNAESKAQVAKALAYEPYIPTTIELEGGLLGTDVTSPSAPGLRTQLFMFDHQGCCYWYAVWPEEPASPADCRVYVLFGGQQFDLTRTAYLTGESLWGFLCDYARKSRLLTE